METAAPNGMLLLKTGHAVGSEISYRGEMGGADFLLDMGIFRSVKAGILLISITEISLPVS